MVKKHNHKVLTRSELRTIINLRKQGLDIAEIGIITGYNCDEVINAFYHSDKLMSKKNISI